MEDEEYARELFVILTNPHPAAVDPEDPYGLAEDGIDRYDGFGRDVWVQSVEVADGEYGAELVVEFGLALPSDPDVLDVPSRGVARLPFDEQWREMSGYLQPAAYAPAVAHEVEIAAYRHVERHRRQSTGVPGADQARAVLPGREAQWLLLLDALGHEGAVREVAPGRVELHDSGAVVTLVITAGQWERVLIDHASGDVGRYFAELLGPRQEDETFVVFSNGDLARSTREKLPPVRSRAMERMLEQARAEDPDAHFRWGASPPQGPAAEPRP